MRRQMDVLMVEVTAVNDRLQRIESVLPQYGLKIPAADEPASTLSIIYNGEKDRNFKE